jgi:hypothetical protein
MEVAVALPAVFEDSLHSAIASTGGMGRALLSDAPAVHVAVLR